MRKTGSGQMQVRGVGVADRQIESRARQIDGLAKTAPANLGSQIVARIDGRGGEFVDRSGVADHPGLGALADDGADLLDG